MGHEFFTQSLFFGVFISLAGYSLGLFVKRKCKAAIFNPLLISVIFVIGALLILRVDYETYMLGAKYLSYLLTPATICLAIPLYQQFELLKKDYKAIVLGVAAGVIACLGSILLFAVIFGFTHAQYVSFLPKSITTAIGLGLSEELGGDAAVTAAAILITGLTGNITAEWVVKFFRITDPVARGLGIGTASHAIGTTKAMELGEVEGAMSSLAIVVTGLITVVAASIFAAVY